MYECQDAIVKGEKEDITVFEFSKSPLIREYGKEFYKGLKKLTWRTEQCLGKYKHRNKYRSCCQK
ncbi:MAG: DUF3109 family protein [Ignavibacteria bacterium]|nr:DUF3109 family protein [Ignavibacteria bacterium]